MKNVQQDASALFSTTEKAMRIRKQENGIAKKQVLNITEAGAEEVLEAFEDDKLEDIACAYSATSKQEKSSI